MSTYPTFSGLFTNFLHFCSYFSLFAFSHFPKSSWMLNCQYNWKKLREHHISWLQKLTQNCDSVNCHRVSHTSQPQPSLNHQDPPTHPQSHVQFLQAELISVNVTTPTQAWAEERRAVTALVTFFGDLFCAVYLGFTSEELEDDDTWRQVRSGCLSS